MEKTTHVVLKAYLEWKETEYQQAPCSVTYRVYEVQDVNARREQHGLRSGRSSQHRQRQKGLETSYLDLIVAMRLTNERKRRRRRRTRRRMRRKTTTTTTNEYSELYTLSSMYSAAFSDLPGYVIRASFSAANVWATTFWSRLA